MPNITTPRYPGTPCPWLRSAMNPENSAATGLPPLEAGQTSLVNVYEQVRAQGGSRQLGVVASGIALIANGFNPVRLLRNLLTLSFDPTKLTGGPVDKPGGDTGILQDLGDGTFSQTLFDRMFDRFSKTYTREDGTTERGLSRAALKQVIDANHAERKGTLITHVIALGELPPALGLYGHTDAITGEKYLSEKDLLGLFRDMKFPDRAPAGSKLGTNPSLVQIAMGAELSPTSKGAALATDQSTAGQLSGPAKGLRNMCPHLGTATSARTAQEAHAPPAEA